MPGVDVEMKRAAASQPPHGAVTKVAGEDAGLVPLCVHVETVQE
jgi:hypothetical protein